MDQVREIAQIYVISDDDEWAEDIRSKVEKCRPISQPKKLSMTEALALFGRDDRWGCTISPVSVGKFRKTDTCMFGSMLGGTVYFNACLYPILKYGSLSGPAVSYLISGKFVRAL